jgi:hypothetical protein
VYLRNDGKLVADILNIADDCVLHSQGSDNPAVFSHLSLYLPYSLLNY